ncbi:hypothetical protein G7046_g8635 [Stylonectria norvegica]|nr:hypothetical protein G7046_g8635 [Stylonectria norvegica]
MLITESHVDVQTTANGKESTMRSQPLLLFNPSSLITNPDLHSQNQASFSFTLPSRATPTLTGPVARFARQIAGQGYIVAAPSSYHDFTGPEPLKYDNADTDRGNQFKIEKTLQSYDADSYATVDYLLSLPTCTGRVGSTGMCLGGHLAVRASLDPRISACVAYFATDIHSRTLGPHDSPNTSATPPADSTHTLDLLPSLKGEVAMIFGVKDTHVPGPGRDLIRAKLREAEVVSSFYEFAWAQHAFIRDELSKGRYDPAITKVCFEVLLELFGRVLKTDLGVKDGAVSELEHIC